MTDIPTFQYKGPSVIPTMEGLYQASVAGSEIGMKVPTVAGAIAQGIEGAVTTAGKIAYQDAQTQNLQADAAYKQAQSAYLLEGTKNQKDLAQIALEKAKTDKINAQVDNQNSFSQMADYISGASAADIKGMLLDTNNPLNGAFNKAVFSDTKQGRGLLANIATRAGNDPEIAKALQTYQTNLQQFDFLKARKDQKNVVLSDIIKKGTEAQGDLAGFYSTWFPDSTDLQHIYSSKMVPSGQLKFGGDGRQDLSAGPNIQGASYDKFDLVGGDGKLIASGLPKEMAEKFGKAKQGYMAGLKQDYDAVYGDGAYDRAFGPKTQQTAPQATPTPQPQNMQGAPTPQPAPTPQAQQPVGTPQPDNPDIVNQLGNKSIVTNPGKKIDSQLLESKRNYFRNRYRRQLVNPLTPQQAQPLQPSLYKPTSFDALSEATNMPVDVNVNTDYSVSPTTFNAVISNPLLQNSSALIKGLAAVETLGGQLDESPTGVRGILQVTKQTARDYGYNRDIPEQQVLAATAYMNDLLSPKWFNGNIALAAAAYNAGQGTIKDAVREAGSTDWDKVKPFVEARVSPAKWKEVENYPERVIKAASQFVNPSSPTDKVFISLLALNNLLVHKPVVDV